jgi:hypothetical protein
VIRFAEYLPGTVRRSTDVPPFTVTTFVFACPECHVPRGHTVFTVSRDTLPPQHWLDGQGGGVPTIEDGVHRVPEADQDGVPAWGVTRGRAEGRHRSRKVPGEKARLHYLSVHGWWAQQYGMEPIFDTWCLERGCGARMRVDSRHAQR